MLYLPVQLLRLERDKVRERDRTKPDRHLQDARHLDRQLDAGLGDAHVAHLALTGRRVRPAGLWHGAWALAPFFPHSFGRSTNFDPSLFLSSCSTTSYSHRGS